MPNNAPHNALRAAVNRALASGSPAIVESPAMLIEYDWTFDVYRPRFGKTFTDFQGYRSFSTREEADHILGLAGLKFGRKTDSRTWAIVAIEPAKA